MNNGHLMRYYFFFFLVGKLKIIGKNFLRKYSLKAISFNIKPGFEK
jgi:hypothetical protein